MKKLFLNQWLGVATGCLLALPCPQPARADADDNPAAKPADTAPDASPVKRNANGEMVVTIDAATQKLIKLDFAHPAVAEWQPVVTGYGRVVDPAPLLAAATDLATAQANAGASDLEYARQKTLAAQNNASARALETAQLASQNNHLALAAARAKLAGDWGSALAGRADLAELVQQLADRKQSLVRLTLPAGENLSDPPSATALKVFPDDSHLLPAELLDAGLGVDPQTEGQIFLFLVKDHALPLGASVTGQLNQTGQPLSGLVLPASAVLRHAGLGWVYVQTAPAAFTRREVPLDRLTETGWFVTDGFSPTNVVVSVGAQTVLSTELSSGAFNTGERD
jgi:hypothetical protein